MGVQFAGNILVQTNGGPLPISAGGTGQTTAPTAINALLPTQTGQSGKILTTNGTNVSWTSGAVTPGGADTNIQFNDAGTFGGNAFFTVNKSTGALTSTSTFKNIGLIISDSDALYRTLTYQTSGSNRWLVQADNTTEAGSNSGSDFEFVRVADNGATTNQVYTVSRATGVLDFKVAPTVNGSAISPPAAAGTLTGTTLAAGVTASSLTSVGTLTSLAVTGVSTTSAVSISGVGLIFSYTLTTSATTAGQVVGVSAIASYRSVKYNISITSGSSYQYTEVTAIHDGTNVYITENCTLTTGSTLATFTADISGGNMRLLTTPINAVTAYKAVSVHIAV